MEVWLALLVSPALTGAVLFFGRRWVGNWVDHKFALRLEDFKNQQSVELEKLKNQLTVVSNRLARIHEWDFGILTDAWRKMQTARGSMRALISPARFYPTLGAMSREGFEEFVERLDWTRWEKKMLLEADKPDDFYADRRRLRELSATGEAYEQFHNFIIDNEPLIGEEISKPLTAIADAMRSTLAQFETGMMNREMGVRPAFPKYEDWEKINQLVTQVRDLMRKRLLAEETVTAS